MPYEQKGKLLGTLQPLPNLYLGSTGSGWVRVPMGLHKTGAVSASTPRLLYPRPRAGPAHAAWPVAALPACLVVPWH